MAVMRRVLLLVTVLYVVPHEVYTSQHIEVAEIGDDHDDDELFSQPTSAQIPYTSRHPVIGILAQTWYSESDKVPSKSYIYSDYVKFMEQSGALVVPVKLNQTDEYYATLFRKLNGVILPGGGATLLTSGYSKSVKHFFDLSKEAFDKNGDIFPILGICWGFQELTARVVQADLLVHCNGTDTSLPVFFTSAARSSRMFSDLPDYLYDALSLWNLTFNNHEFCMSIETFEETEPLAEFYNVLSTNVGKTGVKFVSSFEAYNYPIYGVQWHPAKNMYWWSGANVNHSALAVEASQHISNFFVNEARKSKHRFDSLDDLAGSVIDNYQPTFDGSPSFYSIYLFENEDTSAEKSLGDMNVWDWPEFSRIKTLGVSQVLSFLLFLLLLLTLMTMLSSMVRYRVSESHELLEHKISDEKMYPDY